MNLKAAEAFLKIARGEIPVDVVRRLEQMVTALEAAAKRAVGRRKRLLEVRAALARRRLEAIRKAGRAG